MTITIEDKREKGTESRDAALDELEVSTPRASDSAKDDEKGVGRSRKEKLTLDKGKSWIKAYNKRHPGKWPSCNSKEKVLDEQGQDTGETWRRIDDVLRQRGQGLTDVPEKYSLSQLVDQVSGRPPRGGSRSVNLDYPTFEELEVEYSAEKQAESLRVMIADGEFPCE